MLHKKLVRSKLLIRSLFALIALFLLPLCIISYFSMNVLFQEIRTSLIEINAGTAQSVIEQIDEQFELLARVSSQIDLHESTATWFIKDSPIEKARCQDVLNISKVGLEYVDDIILYVKNNASFYSPSSVFSSDQALYHHLGIRDHSDIYRIEQELNQSREPVYVTITRYLESYRQPQTVNLLLFPNANSYDRRVVIFMLNSGYLPDVEQPEGSGFLVINRNGNVVLQDHVNPLLEEYCIELARDGKESGFTAQVGEENYAFSQINGVYGYSYILYVPLDQVLSRLTSLQHLLFITMAQTLLVGCICIFLTLRVTYTPIKQLYRSLVTADKEDTDGHDEYQAIVNVFEHQSDENRLLRSNCAYSQSQLKQYMFVSLFTNKIAVKQTVLEQLEQKGQILDCQYYAVFVLRATDGIEVICSELEKFSQKTGKICFYVGCKEQVLHIFAVGSDAASVDKMSTFFMDAHKMLQLKVSQEIAMSAGNYYPRVSMLMVSYNQAFTLASMNSDNTLRLFDSISSYEFTELLDSKNWFVNFETAIFNGETQKMSDILSDIMYFVHNNKCSLECGRSICCSLADILLRTVYITREQRFNEENLYLPFSYLNMELHTKENLIEFIDLICKDLDIYLEIYDGVYSNHIFENVKQFLQQNYSDSNFMVQNLSDYFGMSYANISNFFRQQQGETISTFLFRLRINEAKRLLVQTNMPLSEIVIRVGYSDASSFVRKFKNAEGITPGNYRRMNSKGLKENST